MLDGRIELLQELTQKKSLLQKEKRAVGVAIADG